MIFVPCFGIGEWLWHWSKLPVSVVQGYLVSQAPEIINCCNYSGDHTSKENSQQIHKMDKNQIICINFFLNSSSTHLSGRVGYKSWQYCHKELYSTKTRCISQECSLTQYHAGKSQWGDGHLESSSSDNTSNENDSKCAGTETMHNGMKGHFNRVVLVPTIPHEEKPVAKWKPRDWTQSQQVCTSV